MTPPNPAIVSNFSYGHKTGVDAIAITPDSKKLVTGSFGQLCQERGIVLGVETMYPTLPISAVENLLDNEAEVAQFCQDAPQIKIVVDLAHLNIWHDKSRIALDWSLGLPSERILEIHISDNDGWHDIHSRITSDTWWVSHISQFPVGVPKVLESRLNRLPISVVQLEYERIAALIVGS